MFYQPVWAILFIPCHVLQILTMTSICVLPNYVSI
jgi:hypothetical protein